MYCECILKNASGLDCVHMYTYGLTCLTLVKARGCRVEAHQTWAHIMCKRNSLHKKDNENTVETKSDQAHHISVKALSSG